MERGVRGWSVSGLPFASFRLSAHTFDIIVEMSKKCKTNIGNKYIPLYITFAVACVFVVVFSFVLVVTDSFRWRGEWKGNKVNIPSARMG